MSGANGDNLDCLVRLWVVVEEDRGMGATACSCHATEEDATKHCSGHKFADPVDVPWSVLESLKPNAGAVPRRGSDVGTAPALAGERLQLSECTMPSSAYLNRCPQYGHPHGRLIGEPATGRDGSEPRLTGTFGLRLRGA